MIGVIVIDDGLLALIFGLIWLGFMIYLITK